MIYCLFSFLVEARIRKRLSLAEVLGSLVFFSQGDVVFTSTGTYGPHSVAAAAFIETSMIT